MSIRTVSLETAKLLKEAGFRQDTTWYWHFNERYGGSHINLHNDGNSCSAPTTDELLEELSPDLIIRKGFNLRYEVWHPKINGGKLFGDESLPEALSSMYLWPRKLIH